eukprot:SAG22_NODE_230_length_14595_cov_50.767660_8_plen_82_part_00
MLPRAVDAVRKNPRPRTAAQAVGRRAGRVTVMMLVPEPLVPRDLCLDREVHVEQCLPLGLVPVPVPDVLAALIRQRYIESS